MFSRPKARNFHILTLLSFGLFSLNACQDSDDVASPLASETQIQAAGLFLPAADLMVTSTQANATQEKGLRQARNRWESGDGESPMHGFLLEASTFLDTEQMTQLVNLIAEHRQERQQGGEACEAPRRGQRKGQRGQRMGILEYADELALTEDQIAALTALREESKGEFRGQRGQRLTEGQREQMQELREAHQAKVQEILTEEQLAKLEELRAAQREERREAHQARGVERQEQRIEFLAELLDLSDEQREAIEGILAGQHDQIQALSEEFREGLDGERPTEEQRTAHREAMEAVRAETKTAVLEQLDEDQAELFTALENMRPEHRGRRGGRR